MTPKRQLQSKWEHYFYNKLLPMVREHGPTIQSVLPMEHDPNHYVPFSYTIGLTSRRLPELVIFGLDHIVAASILNSAITAVEDHLRLDGATLGALNGTLVHPADHLNAKLLLVHDAEAFYHYALYTKLYLKELKLTAFGHFQVVLPDPNGYYPGHPLGIQGDLPLLA